MTIYAAVTTIIGGFMFPFALRLFWNKFIDKFGALGGWMAALTIIGTIWVLNHGIKDHLVYQIGPIWYDMAWAAGIGVFISTAIAGGSVKRAIPNIVEAILGGILGAFIIVIVLH